MLDVHRRAIISLSEKNGILTPDMVVAAARPRASVLHDLFEWNDKKAADAHRVDQARQLIRMVVVEVRIEKLTIQAPFFVRDPTLAPSQGYRSLGRLKNDEDLAREAVISEFRRASGALARARAIAAVLGMSEEIEAVEGRLDTLIGLAASPDARA